MKRLAFAVACLACAVVQAAPPARIVSTSPSITESLFALGLGSRVVGVSTYCRFPPKVAALPRVGSFVRPDAELIARLRPDLVVVHAGPHDVSRQLLALAVSIVRRAREWNLLAVGDAWAGTRGADVRRLLWCGYVAGSLLAAVTVALTGPIGFIGLVVPHLVRVRVSADDRVLMPCAFFLGGVLLAACDALGRAVLAPAEIPAGAITACIGGPYLVWLVRRRM